MAKLNPKNSGTYSGRLTADPIFIKTKAGIEFSAAFSLAVERPPEKKGEKGVVDFIPCRLIGEQYMNGAHTLKKGSNIIAEGSLNVEFYEKEGQTCKAMYVNIHAWQYN